MDTIDLKDDRLRAAYEAGYLDAAHDLRRAVTAGLTPGRVRATMATAVHQRIFGEPPKPEEKA